MIREEAINRFKGIRESFSISIAQSKFYPSKVILDELCDMAIKALSADGDLISRQWLLDLYGDYIGDNGDPKYHVPLKVVRQNIIDAPPANKLTDGKWLTEYDYDSWKRGYEQGELWAKAEMEHEASVDRSSGEWIYKMNDESVCEEWECSECGNWNFVKTDFCPHCGARMLRENGKV